MELTKITIDNFRQFKHAEIDFSIEDDKPFTIILGSNTYGKTTLIRAFLWCLYGKNDFNDKKLLNKDVADNLQNSQEAEVVVSLDFFHRNFSYRVSAKEIYIKSNTGEAVIKEKRRPSLVLIDETGNSNTLYSLNDIKEEIERNVLDPDLSPYFFFDGETNKIEQVTKNANLKAAVSDIMKLKRVEFLRDCFDDSKSISVPSVFSQKITYSNPILESEYNSRLNELINQKENREKKIGSDQEQVDKLLSEINSLEEILKVNIETKNDQEEKKRLEREIEKEIIKISSDTTKVVSKLTSGQFLLDSLFACSFQRNNFSLKLEKSDFLTEKSISHISVEAVDEIIERGYCLCGEKITDSSEAYKHLQEQKAFIAPYNYGKSIQEFLKSEKFMMNNNLSSSIGYYEMVIKLITEVQEYDTLINRLSTITRRIEGKQDLGEIQSQINTMKAQKNHLEGGIKLALTDIIPSYEKEIKNLRAKIDALSETNEANIFYKECMKYASSIYSVANNTVNNKKKIIRDKLEIKVNEIFQLMYHGNRKIKIDESYKVESILENKDSLETSMGLNTVINFSFVTGLMSLIKDKINDLDNENIEDEIDISDDNDDNYPLVMDAPFSNTDDTHIKRICLALPNYCKQIVIAVMDKDFENASASISSKIGKKYRIIKESETSGTIKEVQE